MKQIKVRMPDGTVRDATDAEVVGAILDLAMLPPAIGNAVVALARSGEPDLAFEIFEKYVGGEVPDADLLARITAAVKRIQERRAKAEGARNN